MLIRSVALTLVATLLAPAPAEPYQAEIQSWRDAREKRLRSDNGWLTLAGLFWLEPGSNTFGSGSANRILLPASVPTTAGTLEFAAGQTRYRLAPGVSATLDGQPAPAEGVLRSDAEGQANVLALGNVSFFVIRRGERYGVRVKDKASATLQGFKGVHWFGVQEPYRVEARFVAYAEPRKLAIANVLGWVEQLESPGYAEFELGGRSVRLEPVLEEPGAEELFFIFRDATSGKSTYGGGRFLYAPQPKDGRIVLDFNKAYTPPCAFTPFATCPLPPAQNRLELPIEAGEQFVAEGH